MSDDPLMDAVLSAVRLEVVHPLRVKVSRYVRDTLTDSHVFEFDVGASVTDTQKEVMSVARRWKGGFPIGTRYVVERLGPEG